MTTSATVGPDELDKVSFIRLNEAVTLLSCGTPRSAADDRARNKAEHDELQALIDLCLDEAAAKPKYRHFPKQLPYSPLGTLIARVETAAMPRPKQSLALLDFARQLAQNRDTRNVEYAVALHKILEAGRTTNLKLRGRRSLRADAPVVRIPKSFLRGDNITADWSGEHLGHVRTSQRPTLGRAIIAPAGELSGVYYKVELDRRQFLKQFALVADHDDAQKHTPPHGFHEVKKWFDDIYVPELLGAGQITKETEDFTAAKARFPKVLKLRDMIRELRRACRPASLRRERGRPQKMRPQ